MPKAGPAQVSESSHNGGRICLEHPGRPIIAGEAFTKKGSFLIQVEIF
jgi:hypothetical protein